MQRRRYSREQWLEWLSEHRGSGLSVSSFCQQKGVSEKSFYVWRRKLAAELAGMEASNLFVPLSVVGAVASILAWCAGARSFLLSPLREAERPVGQALFGRPLSADAAAAFLLVRRSSRLSRSLGDRFVAWPLVVECSA